MNSKIYVIIPARLQSSRFLGKVLQPVMGKSVLQRVYENSSLVQGVAKVFVASRDEEIIQHVESFGGHFIKVTASCENGTDCIAKAVAENDFLRECDVIVNVQGDEPCLPPKTIEKVAFGLINDESAALSTAVCSILSSQELASTSVVKCVTDLNSYALYFSRAQIPGSKQLKVDLTHFKRHIGIYAFRPQFIDVLNSLPSTPLQLIEDLEQLKVLEHGYKIKVVDSIPVGPGVDLPEDLKKVEEWLCSQNLSL